MASKIFKLIYGNAERLRSYLRAQLQAITTTQQGGSHRRGTGQVSAKSYHEQTASFAPHLGRFLVGTIAAEADTPWLSSQDLVEHNRGQKYGKMSQ